MRFHDGALEGVLPGHIPIRIHWLTAVVALLLGYSGPNGANFAGAVMVMVLLLGHELGHAFWARRLGCDAAISLRGTHGACHTRKRRGSLSAAERRVILWGGVQFQAAVFVLALGARVVLGAPTTALGAATTQIFVMVNGLLLVINLLPFGTLDGAQIWKGLPEKPRGQKPKKPAPHLYLVPPPEDDEISPESRAVADAAIIEALEKSRQKSPPDDDDLP